jgi:rhomboid protease GluP
MRSVEKRRMCPNCRAFITTDDRVCPYCDFKLGPSAAARQRDTEPIAGFIPQAGFTTFVILLMNLGLYAATVIVSMNTFGAENAVMDVDGRALVMFGGKYVPYIAAGQWWRLVTAGFLHGGLIHILMNSWVLFSVGAQTEETYGTARYLVLYFVATVGGFLASTYFSASLSVGASAGLFGLIGAMIAAGVRSKTAMGSAIRAQYTQWVIYMVIIGFVLSGIDTAAHLGGLAAGFGIAWVMDQPGAVPRWTDKVWRAAAAVSLGLTALSFGLMLRFLFAA